MSDLVLIEVSDGVATLTLNRPELRNPISASTWWRPSSARSAG